MPIETPTRDELAERAYHAFRRHMRGSDARLWPGNINVVSKVLAEIGWQAISYADAIARQARVSTATDRGLDAHGTDYGLARHPASAAEGAALVSGTNGTPIPIGTEFTRADGVTYTTTESAAVADSTATVAVRCNETGVHGNAAAGVGLTLNFATAGIENSAEVAPAGIGLGADIESDEAFRSRLLFRLQNPPMGGAVHDYVIWGREVPGVSRVFVDPVTATNGRTSVGVWFLTDDLTANGIPLDADVARVENYLQSVQPAGAIVEVNKPVPVTTNITISNLTPDTTAVRDAIRLELQDFFRREVTVSTVEEPATLYYSRLSEAISRATGEFRHTLTTPSADVTIAIGEIAVLGTISYA
jgi:uncharacterized phage protein gp47/JayE